MKHTLHQKMNAAIKKKLCDINQTLEVYCYYINCEERFTDSTIIWRFTYIRGQPVARPMASTTPEITNKIIFNNMKSLKRHLARTANRLRKKSPAKLGYSFTMPEENTNPEGIDLLIYRFSFEVYDPVKRLIELLSS